MNKLIGVTIGDIKGIGIHILINEWKKNKIKNFILITNYSIFLNYMFSSSAFVDFKVSYNKKEDGAYVYENPNDSRYVSDNYLRSESSFLQGGQDKNHNSKSIDDPWFE